MSVQRPGLGIVLIVLMSACFAVMDTTVKYLGAFVPILLVLWCRYAFQALAMAAWLARARHRPGGAGFRAAHPRFQAVRGLLLLATSALGFFGVQHLPVAEFTTINMLTPVIVTLLAAWLLHERVSALRWVLVAGGFAGALVIIRPGSGLFGWAVLFPLGAACCYASFQVLTSKLSALESPFTTHFYTGLVGTLVLTPVLAASLWWAPHPLAGVPASVLALLALIGALGTAGHLMLILALGMAPTATLMPFIYVQIGMAGLVGWLVFGHAPDRWGWFGAAIVAACGAGSIWLNAREAAAARRPTSPVTADTLPE
jgi:drug/metabolite transporter (DMT)-like permease